MHFKIKLTDYFKTLCVALFITATPTVALCQEINDDPFEKYNRFMFSINIFADDWVFKPVAVVYDAVIPDLLKQRVTSVISLWSYPIDILNYSLQGDGEVALRGLRRFSVSVVLTAGIADIGDEIDGDGYENTDFNKTLASYGVPSGPYIVLPMLGPKSIRGSMAFPVTLLATSQSNKISIYKDYLATFYVLGLVDLRYRNIETIESLESTSMDYYSTVRGIIMQNEKNIAQDKSQPSTPDFNVDFDELYSDGLLNIDLQN